MHGIDFTLTYAENDLVDVKWTLDCMLSWHLYSSQTLITFCADDEDDKYNTKMPTNMFITYKWEELREKDITWGLGFLFISGFAMGGGLLIFMVLDMEYKSRKGYVDVFSFCILCLASQWLSRGTFLPCNSKR